MSRESTSSSIKIICFPEMIFIGRLFGYNTVENCYKLGPAHITLRPQTKKEQENGNIPLSYFDNAQEIELNDIGIIFDYSRSTLNNILEEMGYGINTIRFIDKSIGSIYEGPGLSVLEKEIEYSKNEQLTLEEYVPEKQEQNPKGSSFNPLTLIGPGPSGYPHQKIVQEKKTTEEADKVTKKIAEIVEYIKTHWKEFGSIRFS